MNGINSTKGSLEVPSIVDILGRAIAFFSGVEIGIEYHLKYYWFTLTYSHGAWFYYASIIGCGVLLTLAVGRRSSLPAFLACGFLISTVVSGPLFFDFD